MSTLSIEQLTTSVEVSHPTTSVEVGQLTTSVEVAPGASPPSVTVRQLTTSVEIAPGVSPPSVTVQQNVLASAIVDVGGTGPQGPIGVPPPATEVGQVLLALDATTFTPKLPLVSEAGWLLNDDGFLMVIG